MTAGYGWISLTTDYGLTDGFVAMLHGVIARHAPDVRVIDVTHDVHPGDLAAASAVLAQVVPHMPPAVHVAIVDPGVGTRRRGVAIRTDGGILVGPDNGVLLPAADALGGALERGRADQHGLARRRGVADVPRPGHLRAGRGPARARRGVRRGRNDDRDRFTGTPTGAHRSASATVSSRPTC